MEKDVLTSDGIRVPGRIQSLFLIENRYDISKREDKMSLCGV